jgi:hypothetical protein
MRKPARPRAHEDLGVDEGADRRDLERVEHGAAEHLEGAVDVAHAQAEERAHEDVPSSTAITRRPSGSRRGDR